MSGEGGAIAEVLAAHAWQDDTAQVGNWAVLCTCNGWRATGRSIYALRAQHDTHRADHLADLLAAERQRGREEALREAAKEAEERGDIGKDGGYEAWDWLAIRADQAASIARTPDESEAR